MDSLTNKQTQIYKKCCICNSKIIKSIGYHPDFPNTQISKCFCCGVIFANPIPKNDYLAEIYFQEYREKRNESPSEIYLERMSKRAKAQKKYIEKNLSITNENLLILDVGCGAGLLLKEFINNKNKLYGFEPDRAMYLAANRNLGNSNVQLWNQVFDINLIKDKKFDIILLSHILEHIPNPINFINELLLLLSKTGVIFIEVPNDTFRLVCEQIDKKIKGSMHIYFFNPCTLKKIISNCNGKITNIITCGRRINKFSYMYQIRADIKGKIKWNLFWFVLTISKFTSTVSRELINKFSPLALKTPTLINWDQELSLEYKKHCGIWIRTIVSHRN